MAIIETPRLIIRPPEHRDIEELVRIYTSRVCMRFLGGVVSPEETRKRFEDIIELQDRFCLEEKLGTWVIHYKADNKCIGVTSLDLCEIDGTKEVAMTILLSFSHWGKELAKEAASAIRDYCFFEVGLQRVVAQIDPHNKPSLKVAQDICMECEKQIENGNHLYVFSTQCWLDDERSKYFESLLNDPIKTHC